MSKHKYAVPSVYVVGSSPMLDAKGHRVVGIREPLKTAGGKPVGSSLILATELWNEGKVLGVVSHWRNAAARRRAEGDMTKAKPNELVQVPVYRGIPASLASVYRADNRREQRKSMVERIKASIQARMAGKPKEAHVEA